MKFKDIPIHICEKAPKDKPYLIPFSAKICPFCHEKLEEIKIKEERSKDLQ